MRKTFFATILLLLLTFLVFYKTLSDYSSRYNPEVGISWHLQLTGEINTSRNVDLYDIDLEEVSQEVIDELHSKGIKVICYFSAGTWESYRADANQFPREVLGNALEDWPDEKWLDISNYEAFAHIMRGRFDLAVQKRCDGVDPDNVDAFQNNSGFDLSYEDQLTYNKWLAEEAHKRNLAISLKNDLDQIKDLVDYFDFAINEQCFSYKECNLLTPFIEQGKPVLGVEYELELDEFCTEANNLNFSWLKMDYDLDGGRRGCGGMN